MAFCNICGAQTTSEKKFCVKCGSGILPKETNQIVHIEHFKRRNDLKIIGIIVGLLAFSGLVFWFLSKNQKENQEVYKMETNSSESHAQSNSDKNKTEVQSQQEDMGIKTTQFNPGYYIANASETRKIYFHNAPDQATRRKAYLTTQETVYVQKVQNNFGYIEFVNSEQKSSFGWVEMQYLIMKPN